MTLRKVNRFAEPITWFEDGPFGSFMGELPKPRTERELGALAKFNKRTGEKTCPEGHGMTPITRKNKDGSLRHGFVCRECDYINHNRKRREKRRLAREGR